MEPFAAKCLVILKKALLLGILVLLILPALQNKFGFFRTRELKGYFETSPRPAFTLHDWKTGEYQEKYMKFRGDSVGFRNLFIRLYNEIDYSLFSVPHAEQVILGKNNMLFTKNYIMAWLGRGMIGQNYIGEKVRELKRVQDILWTEDSILLMVVFPPEKTWFYPGNIPGPYCTEERVTGNYEEYLRGCKKYGVNFIDVNQWFLDLKDTVQNLLFPLNGTHWSDYGAYIAADSLARYIEKKTGRQLPELVHDGYEMTDMPRHNDDDISRTMNLFREIKNPVLAHPKYHVAKGPDTMKPSVLFIGDSFYWGWDDQGLTDSLFRDKEFWYYFREIFPIGPEGPKTTGNIDKLAELRKRDVVILIHVCGGAGNLGSGFIDWAYATLDTSKENQIRELMNRIRTSPEWLKTMEEKAKKNGITLDNMILEDAIFMHNTELLKKK